MPRPVPGRRDAVLSTQVSHPRYFFLGLTGTDRAGVFPAYGGFEHCNADFLVQRERFGFSGLELVVAGEGWVRLDGTVHALRAGSLFSYDRTTRLEIRTDPDRPMAKYFLCLTGARARTRLRAAGLRPGGLIQLAMFPEAQRVLEDLIREGRHHRTGGARLCAALVEVLLLKIEQLAGFAGPPAHTAEETFLRCQGAIEAQAAQLGNLGEITRAVGVGTTRLSRLFRRYQGRSPYQHLLQRKMELAAELLMNPTILVKEAGAQVGFADQYHFSRCFKKIHGIGPREFRRSHRPS